MEVKNDSSDWLFDFVIIGEPASKANSRKIKWSYAKQRKILAKSDKALAYAEGFALQCPKANPLILDEVEVEVTIWYATQRPDLDPSVIFDGLQNSIIKNDRQIREFHAYHAIDKANPRSRIRVRKRRPMAGRGDAGF